MMQKTNTTQGGFLVIDGPNAVGKTTVVHLVAQYLREAGEDVLETKEPTMRFDRDNEEKTHGLELARRIVEDRRRHVIEDIEPALLFGAFVVCDRYLCASLVYRALDGVPLETTWNDNKSFRIPDFNVILTASPDVLAFRLETKSKKSRFEREHTSGGEVTLYKTAMHFLEEHGYSIREISNDTRSAAETAQEIAETFLALR